MTGVCIVCSLFSHILSLLLLSSAGRKHQYIFSNCPKMECFKVTDRHVLPAGWESIPLLLVTESYRCYQRPGFKTSGQDI